MRLSKKSVVRQWLEREKPVLVGRAEAEVIRRELARELGQRGRISDDYLLNTLEELGAQVAAEMGGLAPETVALLRYDTLEAAEATLRALDERYRAGSPEAAAEARRAALRARRRAALVARNPRVAPGKRAEKEEIAQWFSIWLQTPDIFFDWLEVRKRTTKAQRHEETY